MPQRLDRRFTNRARGDDWYRLVTNQAGTAELWIYDEIGYWGTTAGDVVARLSELDVSTIDLHVNSLGGEVFDGLAIYECVRTHPARVTAYVDGIAASIASVITMAGNEVVMGRNAQMMIHDASGGCWGTADDMETTARVLRAQTANIAAIYADRTGVPVDTWLQRMSDETWYFGHEAVAVGLADRLAPMHKVPDRTDDPDTDMTNRLSIFRFAGRAQAPPPVLDRPTSGTEPAGSDPTPTDPPTEPVPTNQGPVWTPDLSELMREAFK